MHPTVLLQGRDAIEALLTRERNPGRMIASRTKSVALQQPKPRMSGATIAVIGAARMKRRIESLAARAWFDLDQRCADGQRNWQHHRNFAEGQGISQGA
jgi:hypothetical protein